MFQFEPEEFTNLNGNTKTLIIDDTTSVIEKSCPDNFSGENAKVLRWNRLVAEGEKYVAWKIPEKDSKRLFSIMWQKASSLCSPVLITTFLKKWESNMGVGRFLYASRDFDWQCTFDF